MPSMGDASNVSDPQAFWSNMVLHRLTLTDGVSPRHGISTIAKTRQALDDELSAIRGAMCSILTRRNALCPISSLPPEVLVRIFKCYATIQPPVSYRQRPLGWIEVTHVCRLWRNTALQFPSLWSNICFRLGTQCAEAMLARSAATPVSILCPMLKPSPSSMSLVSEHLRHTRYLSLVGASMDLVQPFVYALPSPSTILENLEICFLHEVSTVRGDNFELPGTIAGCHLPSLRRISLHGFWVPWSARILCNLTHLEIQLHEADSHKRLADAYLDASHEDLCSVLTNLPALEALILVNCLPSGPWKGRCDEALQLPRLKALQLQGPSATCFGIAKWLRIPPSCQLQLRCNDETDIAEILPCLHAHVSGGTALPPWHTLLLIHDLVTGFRLQMWRLSDTLPIDDDFDLDMDADLAIWFSSSERSLQPLKVLCRALPLETVRTVHVSLDASPFDHDILIRDWVDILGRCAEVNRAWVSNDQAISFCKALSMTTDPEPRPVTELDRKDRKQERLFLGKLETLKLSNMDFRIRGEYLESDQAFHRLLIEWLSDRLEVHASPTLDINLEECTVKEEWVEDLKRVANVEWDNDDGDCSSSSEEEGCHDYYDHPWY